MMNFFDTYWHGWILDGPNLVGTFCSFTEERNLRRKIRGVKLESGDYNLDPHYNKALRFIWAERYTVGCKAPSKLIEDFGFGVIVGSEISPGAIDCMKINLQIAMCQNPNMKLGPNQKPALLLSGWYGFNDCSTGRHPAVARLHQLRARQLF